MTHQIASSGFAIDYDEDASLSDRLVREQWKDDMAKCVNLDAMIPRADFGEVETVSKQERISNFGIEHLSETSPIFRALRKPDFQRETNHWSAKQICDLIKSFLAAKIHGSEAGPV